MKLRELEIYIHIPFCVSKCRYCDFLSGKATEETKNAYMDALCKEIHEKSFEYREYQVISVFIGGGTPTTVEAGWIEKIMNLLREDYSLHKEAEITLEMNPGTVNKEDLEIFKKAGINRLSIGLQSANDKELRTLGRIHTYQDFADCYIAARSIGFSNINVDIMSAIPGQTVNSYKETLRAVTSLVPPPEHISAYSLIIEEGTPFFDAYERDELDLPGEDTERAMYGLTREFLQQWGYERYEISNYAKEGMECKHNIGYWQRVNYVGFGIGAASLIENKRFSNNRDLKKYIGNPIEQRVEEQVLSREEQMEEMMFLGLRMCEGVCYRRFEEIFGVTIENVYDTVIEKHIKNGLLELIEKEQKGKFLRLTEKGMDLCNYVMADFLEPEIHSK